MIVVKRHFVIGVLLFSISLFSLKGYAQNISFGNKCPEQVGICEEVIIDLLKRAILPEDPKRIHQRIRKPSFIFAPGNTIAEEYKKYISEEDFTFITEQFNNPVIRNLHKRYFENNKQVKIKKTSKVSKLKGSIFYLYLPLFSKDLKTCIIYYEEWSSNLIGQVERQATYKVFQYDSREKAHILQAKTDY